MFSWIRQVLNAYFYFAMENFDNRCMTYPTPSFLELMFCSGVLLPEESGERGEPVMLQAS